MTDLEPLFHHLVRTLAADPTCLRQPIPLADLATSIPPPRSQRRAFGADPGEEHELLLRLAAGEGGFARTEPPATAARLEAELRRPRPDVGLLQRLGDAVLRLSPGRVTVALAMEAEVVPPDPSAAAVPSEAGGAASACACCGGALPTDRVVNFCPHCGEGQAQARCAACGSDLRPGWRHCVTCGLALGGR